MKKIFLFILSLFLLASCGVPKSEVFDENNKIEVVSSIVPLASITSYIGGDYVNVESIIPAGVSPHSYELKPQDLINIENSDLIVSVGLEHIDGFLDKKIDGKNVLNSYEGIDLISGFEDDDEHEEENHEEGLEDDPHIWTSSANAIEIATKIQKRLSEISPANAVYFQQNLEFFKSEITEINLDFERKIKDKEISEFVVFHNAYNYLFKDLGITDDKKLVFRTSVLSEPDSAELKDLIDHITTDGVKTIFREPQFSDANLEKLATDYDLNILVLDPLGQDISKRGYLENYKANLENLLNIYE